MSIALVTGASSGIGRVREELRGTGVSAMVAAAATHLAPRRLLPRVARLVSGQV